MIQVTFAEMRQRRVQHYFKHVGDKGLRGKSNVLIGFLSQASRKNRIEDQLSGHTEQHSR